MDGWIHTYIHIYIHIYIYIYIYIYVGFGTYTHVMIHTRGAQRIVLMLVEGALQQRFHFTAYAVNSYVERGTLAHNIEEGRTRLTTSVKLLAPQSAKKVRTCVCYV